MTSICRYSPPRGPRVRPFADLRARYARCLRGRQCPHDAVVRNHAQPDRRGPGRGDRGAGPGQPGARASRCAPDRRQRQVPDAWPRRFPYPRGGARRSRPLSGQRGDDHREHGQSGRSARFMAGLDPCRTDERTGDLRRGLRERAGRSGRQVERRDGGGRATARVKTRNAITSTSSRSTTRSRSSSSMP